MPPQRPQGSHQDGRQESTQDNTQIISSNSCPYDSLSAKLRLAMIDRLAQSELGLSPEVLKVMAATPRDAFVSSAFSPGWVYDEHKTLPIGFGQTISRALNVAWMSSLILPKTGPDSCVLELGSGSGYQTAILSQLTGQLISLERILPLHKRAKQALKRLGYQRRGVQLYHDDGASLDHLPKPCFDAILLTAQTNQVTSFLPLLKDEGYLVLPLIGPKGVQMTRIQAAGGAIIQQESLGEVRFVSLQAGKVH